MRKKLTTTFLVLAIAAISVASFASKESSVRGPSAQEIARPTLPVAYDLVISANAQSSTLRLSAVEAPRIMGYMMLAAYTAWNGAEEGMSRDVAAAVAGAETAAKLYTEPTRGAEMLIIPTRYGAERHPDAVAYGKTIATRVLELASTSGYEETRGAWSSTNGSTSYPWEPTGRGEPGIEPLWGNIKPVISSTTRCSLFPPSSEAVLAEAKELLKNYNRTAAVGDDVMWWLAGTGTPTPSGQWLRMSISALQAAKVDEDTAMKVLTYAAVAAGDVGIAGWREKYAHSVARPETMWKEIAGVNAPVLPRETPNHPSYPSGHSFFGSAVSTVLIGALGDVPLADQLPADMYVPAQTKNWASATEALQEAGMSRVNAGFHYPMDISAGQELGRCVAEKVSNGLDKLSKELQR
jgi:hypothetical protein